MTIPFSPIIDEAMEGGSETRPTDAAPSPRSAPDARPAESGSGESAPARNRIDNDDHGELDDVVLNDIESIHIERMDSGVIWMAVYVKGVPLRGMHFWFNSSRKIKWHLGDGKDVARMLVADGANPREALPNILPE